MPEATIRSRLDYARAADLRARSAPGSADTDIARLTARQVKLYVDLPDAFRDRWLSAGADVHAFDVSSEHFGDRVIYELKQFGLGEFLDGKNAYRFEKSLTAIVALCRWLTEHLRLQQAVSFVQPVAKLALPAIILECLPCGVKGCEAFALIAPERWKSILAEAKSTARGVKGLKAAIEAGVRRALREAGFDPAEVAGPETAELLQIVEGGPDFIRETNCLTLPEQAELVLIKADAPGELVLEAKRLVCDCLAVRRGKDVPADRPAHELRDLPGTDVIDVFGACLAHVRHQQQAAEEEDLFGDPERLFGVVLECLTETAAISNGQVDGRPASDILAERLDMLDWPEFKLVASFVLIGPCVDNACRCWLEALDRAPQCEE